MLLSSSTIQHNQHSQVNGDLVCQLINSERCAEAYQLLKDEPAGLLSTQYNLALCHHWVENYTEALICLDKAEILLPSFSGRRNMDTDGFYKALIAKQNQLNLHLQPVSEKYLKLFTEVVADDIKRLKTDCWLKLEKYAKVLETASPIIHKNYHNINKALIVAKQNL